MPTAKENFLSRMANFENSLSSPDLVSRALTEVDHNQKAKMLRNGMAIIGYTILEDFIKKRTGEVFKKIGSSTVQFNRLPLKLQEASTVDALKGIQSRAKVLKANLEDYKAFIQHETLCISSTKESVYEISEYSLGYDKSNLSDDDIPSFLRTFNVIGGWTAIQQISSAINVTLVNPAEIFRTATQRRHKAAHDAEADSLLSNLQDFVSQSIVIGFSFDILISQSLKYINSNNHAFLAETLKTDQNQLSFRFLIEDSGKWKEFVNRSPRAYRVNATYLPLFNDALTRARTNNQILLVKGNGNKILGWYNE